MATHILLVNPPSRENAYRELKEFAFNAPPMGLAYLAAYVAQHKVAVDIIDSDPLGLDMDATVARIKHEEPKCVGVTAMTATVDIAKELIQKMRAVLPHVIIILGGVHATALPERTMAEIPELDVIVIGEGEQTLYELLSVLKRRGQSDGLHKVKGICFRKDGQLIITEKRPFITDLDSLPFPARHLLPIDIYHGPGWFRWIYGYTKPFVNIFTSRGCPYNCNFCASNLMAGRSVRYRSIPNVLAEVDYLKQKYDMKILSIEDDSFTLDKERTIAICKELIKRNYNLHIMCETRVDHINEEVLQYLKKAGVDWLFFGVESGNQKILDRAQKGITLEQVERAVALTKKVGIGVHTGFILGHLGETRETACESIRFLKKLMPDHVGIATLIPFPGSHAWEYCQEKNIPLPKKWNDFGMVNALPISVNPELSAQELLTIRDRAIVSYYANPQRLWRMFTNKKYDKRLLIHDHMYNLYALIKRKMKQHRQLAQC